MKLCVEELGVSVAAPDAEEGLAMLHHAARNGHEQTVRALLLLGAKADRASSPPRGSRVEPMLPTFLASGMHGTRGTLQALVEEGGADIAATNQHGESLLFQAAHMDGWPGVVT